MLDTAHSAQRTAHSAQYATHSAAQNRAHSAQRAIHSTQRSLKCPSNAQARSQCAVPQRKAYSVPSRRGASRSSDCSLIVEQHRKSARNIRGAQFACLGSPSTAQSLDRTRGKCKDFESVRGLLETGKPKVSRSGRSTPERTEQS